MTTLAKIEKARRPEFKKMNQTEVTTELSRIISGPCIPRTIVPIDPEAAIKTAQLYVEFYLNKGDLKTAEEFADDVESLRE